MFMENNFSDKQMRDKLKGIEAPYDPKAWGQMESMLDEKKERRPAFWWWFGGAAACMLLLGGVLGYKFSGSSSQSSVNTGQTPVSSLKSSVNTNQSPVRGLQSLGKEKQSAVNTNQSPAES